MRLVATTLNLKYRMHFACYSSSLSKTNFAISYYSYWNVEIQIKKNVTKVILSALMPALFHFYLFVSSTSAGVLGCPNFEVSLLDAVLSMIHLLVRLIFTNAIRWRFLLHSTKPTIRDAALQHLFLVIHFSRTCNLARSSLSLPSTQALQSS